MLLTHFQQALDYAAQQLLTCSELNITLPAALTRAPLRRSNPTTCPSMESESHSGSRSDRGKRNARGRVGGNSGSCGEVRDKTVLLRISTSVLPYNDAQTRAVHPSCKPIVTEMTQQSGEPHKQH